MKLKAFDFVTTPGGGVAMVTETHDYGDNYTKELKDNYNQCSIVYITNEANEHNAWWNSGELKKVNSLILMLAKEMAHPFGNGKKDAEKYFNS